MQCKERHQCSCESQMRLVSSRLILNFIYTGWLYQFSTVLSRGLLRIINCYVVPLYISGDCNTATCPYGATCKVISGVAKCECDFTCSNSKSLVCGSDLKTYDNECKMKEAACNAKKNVSVLVRDKCG